MSMVPAEEHEMEVDGRRLAWRAAGNGPPLLLINGYAATAADWDPALLASLRRSFQVICPDNRGMGGSDLGDPGGVTVPAMAEDLVALLNAVGIDRATVAGWSMGAFVAQALTVRAPERVSALVLLSSDPGGSGAVAAPPAVWIELTDHSGTPREQASRLITLLFGAELAPQIDLEFGEIVAAARGQLQGATLEAQEAAIRAWYTAEPPPLPPRTPPVLVAAGSDDVVIPPENMAALAARWPNARLELFEGGGHAFMAQEPQRLAALIAEFAGSG